MRTALYQAYLYFSDVNNIVTRLRNSRMITSAVDLTSFKLPTDKIRYKGVSGKLVTNSITQNKLFGRESDVSGLETRPKIHKPGHQPKQR